MALILGDKSPARKTATESGELMAGADDSMLLAATETLDGVAQELDIVALVVNTAGTVTELIANDGNNTNVALGGLVKGYKNLTTDLQPGTYIQAGKYGISASWNKVVAGTASIMVYYKYKTSTRA